MRKFCEIICIIQDIAYATLKDLIYAATVSLDSYKNMRRKS